jgi:signal transduction histidine kinase
MENVPDEIKEILNIVSASMLQLDNFIENTHDHHRLKKDTHISDISFDHLVSELISQYSSNARRNNTKFVFSVEQREHFRSDEMLLKVILNNLLSNAFKYQKEDAPDKYVSLSVEVFDGKAHLLIKDNGIGMNTFGTTNIFDAFYRNPSKESGSGLGLFNAKDAIEKLGGSIEVTSEVNHGSEFKIVLPDKA